MDQAQKDRLVEEAKQRQFMDICATADTVKGDELKDKVMAVGIVEAGTLRGLVEHIFAAAAEDIKAHDNLADLVSKMPSHLEPPAAPEPKKEEAPAEEGKPKARGSAASRGNTSEKKIDFRLMVLKKSKEEIEKGSTAKKALKGWEEREEKAGKGNKLGGEEREQMKADKAAYLRMLTMVQFCGSLYMTGILTEKIIHSCVDVLIKDDEPRFECLEVLVVLLAKIGTKLEASTRSSRDGKVVTGYFTKMEKIRDEAVSKQVAKMMSEVLTLRENKWVDASA